MKKTILFISALLISILTFSQDKIILNNGDSILCKITSVEKDFIFLINGEGEKSKIITSLVKNCVFEVMEIKNNIAGSELFEGANSMFVATGFGIGSALFSIMGAVTLNPAFFVISGIGGIIAIIKWIGAWVHIRNAGMILKESKL